MKTAIYARVSRERCPRAGCGHLYSDHYASPNCTHPGCHCTEYQGQDPENQLIELRRYAAAQGWEVVEYVDRATGKNADREALQEMFQAASRREFGVLLVWALDRLSREGILETLQHLKRLKNYGVQFESFTEPHFRTTGPLGEMFGELMIAFSAMIAKQERLRISDRTKAGLERARAKGRVGGRPPKIFDRSRARAMRAQAPPVSWRVMSREFGVPQSSIRKVLARPEAQNVARSHGVHKTSPKKP